VAVPLLCVLVAAACTGDNPVNGSLQGFVATGKITVAGSPLASAIVRALADNGSRVDTTDASGAFMLQMDLLPDSVQICVSATGYADTCANYLFPPETLLVDMELSGSPPKDTVWLPEDMVFAGDTAEIVLGLSNPDSAIAGMNLWLKSEDPGIVFDTVTLVSPRFPVAGMSWQVFRHDSINTIAILFVDYLGKVVIPPGRGPIMRLRYVVDSGHAPGSFGVDTTSAIVSRPVDISFESGLSIPSVVFVPGRVVVQ